MGDSSKLLIEALDLRVINKRHIELPVSQAKAGMKLIYESS